MSFTRKKIVEFSLFLLILFWCIGIFWEVVYHFYPNAVIYLPILKYNYSIVCHTEPEKLFNIFHFNSLTCSRCTGIYFGGLFSSMIVLFSSLKTISLRLFLLSSVPMFLDVILYSSGIYTYSKYFALFTGLLLGSVGFLYIHNSIIELLNKPEGKN